jgi:hypothetical protein
MVERLSPIAGKLLSNAGPGNENVTFQSQIRKVKTSPNSLLKLFLVRAHLKKARFTTQAVVFNLTEDRQRFDLKI